MSEKDAAQRLGEYKAISLTTKILLGVNALAAGLLLITPTYWAMTLLGLGVLTQSALVLANRHIIMDEYVHEIDGKEVSSWRKPSQAVYRLNVYVVWPLLLFAGLTMLVIGFINL